MAFDANNPAASGMVLTFDDEFNSLSASGDGPAKGTTWTNHPWYVPAPADNSGMTVHDGVLDMTTTGANGWASHELFSVNAQGQGFAQKYGYFEARIKLPAGDGAWGAFWSMSTDHVKDAGITASEMDTMESQGNTPGSYWATLHSSTGTGGDQINQNHEIATGQNLSDDFHIFGALWDPHSDHIAYYLDGKEMIDVPKWASTDGAKMFVALSAMSGGWGGNAPDHSTPDPNYMFVDWVRVWQFADQHPQAVAMDVPPPVVAPAVEPPVVEPAVVAPAVDATPTVPPVPQVEATPTPIDYTYSIGTGGA